MGKLIHTVTTFTQTLTAAAWDKLVLPAGVTIQRLQFRLNDPAKNFSIASDESGTNPELYRADEPFVSDLAHKDLDLWISGDNGEVISGEYWT